MKFSDVLRKHLKTMTQAELGKRLGLPPDKAQKYISLWKKADQDSTIEKQWTVFKKLIIDLDPEALFDDINSVRALNTTILRWRRSLPEDLRAELLEGLREIIEEELDNDSSIPTARDIRTVKPKSAGKSKAKR